ncbi:hypothetical protein PPACK8108_LOCUS26540 [Phakopsora pachyrhizi]|uniref:DUF7872 domain-containing protein n=1 Tax=Phakopsora pachyrhizi TaxID=170000 RepID=A0AAV0B301_PHAPC|nr:hypothetical protein PPACK8108_LOCUS11241 [Phakopsora pachyrhizi]CAH7691006.1 hypothetical protein PPACK8108_LOCUS26540 [Phakopsora pachyrhizi]
MSALSQIPLANCINGPINPELWNSLGMDNYLKNYLGGKNLTLTQYAASVHSANFICGIGRRCLAGQPCAPVQKLDWLVLYSSQQWNFYMNSLHDAVEASISIVVGWTGLTITVGILSIMVLAAASALMFVGPTAYTLLAAEAVGEGAAVEAVGGSAVIGSAAVAPLIVRRHQKETLSTDLFGAYARLDNDLTILYSKLKKVIFLNVDAVLRSPISSDQGLYNLLKNGTFLTANPSKLALEADARRMAQLTMMSELFKSLRMFILVGKDPCIYDGPNGAFSGIDILSYCTPDGLMMNIVRAEGDKLVQKIPHADLLTVKYGFSTEFLASTAIRCQVRSKNSSQAESKNNQNDQCAFTAPVCDARVPDIRNKILSHQKVVIACREGGKLLI